MTRKKIESELSRTKRRMSGLLAFAQWWARPTIMKNTRPATITPVQITNIPRMGARVLRLLRKQPGGFEGLVGLGEHSHRHNHAVSDRPQLSSSVLDLGAADLGSRPSPDDDRYLVAALDEFLRLGGPLLECTDQVLQVPLTFLAPSIRTGIDSRWGRQLEIPDAGRERRVGVAAIERLIDRPDDLDVLLRHRPLSIARWRAPVSGTVS